MKISLECYSCFLRQTMDAVRFVPINENKRTQIFTQVLETLPKIDNTKTAPEIAKEIHSFIRQETKADPYRQIKQTCTEQALAVYSKLKQLVAQASNPLETAIRISIAGNIIDLATTQSFDLDATIDRVLHQDFAINNLDRFYQTLKNTDNILYLADNAGETVFDRVLIETLDKKVIYVVKGSEILNDAVYEDAIAAGVDKVATIIDNGNNLPGTKLELCSKEFITYFNQAQLIISKGQGNYETLHHLKDKYPIFFLLQTKCQPIARHLNLELGSIVLW